MSKYPLCKQAGLSIDRHAYFKCIDHDLVKGSDNDWIAAADVEAYFAKAPIVCGFVDKATDNFTWGGPGLFCDEDTHSARVILIEPIVKDTAEDLLREFVEAYQKSELGIPKYLETGHKLYDKAKKLLESK